MSLLCWNWENVTNTSPRIKVSAGLLVLMVVAAAFYVIFTKKDEEKEAESFMLKLNAEAAKQYNQLVQTRWNYMTNLTEENRQKSLQMEMAVARWNKEQSELLSSYDWMNFKNSWLKRQFETFSSMGSDALPTSEKEQLEEVLGKMEKIYSTTNLRPFKAFSKNKEDNENKTIPIQPDLLNIFAANDKTSCELSYYWEGWHGMVGQREKKLFEEWVILGNEAARLNNYTDMAEAWVDSYEMDDFESHIDRLYHQILPLYKELHSYVRYKLSEKYNDREEIVIQKNGPIPAHILGNIWGQQWPNIFNSTIPYKNKRSLDVTPEMIAQNYTVMKMFKLAEEFFLSLNLSAMTETFWQKSMFVKPKDREVVCHGSAWNFMDGEDYRIKMCTTVNYLMLKTIHHEMGHVQYYQQYKNQPYIFQTGANPGFHEAVGDTLALSVGTAEHLKKIGLVDPTTYVEDKEADINSLFLLALDKVAFLPYAYTLEKWRWEVFRQNVTPSHYNCRYWQIRQELAGIKPPVERTSRDFDPGAKYHIINSTPYIRYFVSFIIQFQFHKALCIKAGKYDPDNPTSKPLHKCDIYQSVEAGNLFRSMLQLGMSKPWQDAMEVLTGQRDMDAGPLLEYFHPLQEWLEQENKKNGQTPSWTVDPNVNGCSENSSATSTAKSPRNPCRYVFNDSFKEEIEQEERDFAKNIKKPPEPHPHA